MKIVHAIVVTSVLSAGLLGCAEIKRQSAIGAKKLVKILEDDGAVSKPNKAPRYCYQNIGRVDCYGQPLPASEAGRLVGYHGPPPRTTAGSGPYSP